MNFPELAGPADVALTLAGVGALLLLLSVPMWRVWIRRNRLYGARTPISLASDVNWRIVNRRSGRAGIQAGLALMAIAPVVLLVLPEGWSENAYEAVVALGLLLAIAWPVRAMFAAEEATPRSRVTLWPEGTQGPPREEEDRSDR